MSLRSSTWRRPGGIEELRLRAGFGQRLVFDNSSDYSPNGLYLDDQLFSGTDLATACKRLGDWLSAQS